MRKAGETAPDFDLPGSAGGRSTLSGKLAHGPVLLAFFKITCPTCQMAFPYLGRMASEAGVPVIGVSQDGPEGTEAFNRKFGVTFSTLIDSAESGYLVSNAYAITNVPSLFMIEPDGRIALSESGFSRSTFEEIGQRFGRSPFRETDQVPEFKPG